MYGCEAVRLWGSSSMGGAHVRHDRAGGVERFEEEPVSMPTRRTVFKGSAAVAGLAAVQAPGLAPAADAANRDRQWAR